MDMRDLLDEIAASAKDANDQWCSVEKAQTLASIVVGLRPRTVLEIGVWMGGSLMPMLLALKFNKRGEAIAIDPWSSEASVVGQTPENAKWWGEVDHEAAYRAFLGRLATWGVHDICAVHRMRSDESPLPPAIDLLHVDGNHAEQVLRDVNRFVPFVAVGGIVIIDDVAWDGSHVMRAAQRARELGCVDLYPLDKGIVMQRVSTV
jgi:predicted O-methyltransferase YrrM